MSRTHLKLMISIFALWSLAGQIQAQDWTSWRGPKGDGISPEVDWNPSAIKDIKVKWSKELGEGYSAVSVKDQYVYTMGFKDNKNTIYCFNSVDGKEVWKFDYPTSTVQHPGTRCTPVIDGGLLYTVGQQGDFYCNDAMTGKVKWSHNLEKEFKYSKPMWGFSTSVLVIDDLVYLNAGSSGIAFNKTTGKVKWSSKEGACNYATPVKYMKNGKVMVAIYGNKNLYGVDALTGKVDWEFPWPTRYDIIAADPVMIDNDSKIFISSGYNNGCALIDISSGTPKQLWKNGDMCNHFSTSLVFGDYLYGIDGNVGSGSLKCMSIKDGKVIWSQDLGFGNLMATANNIIILITEKGNLHMVKADPKGFQEIASAEKVLPKLCWTVPVLSGKTLYLRNDQGNLVCIDLK